MNRSTFRNTYGPWAVVTGASDGIGREFARELASLGLNLVLVARRKLELESLGHDLAHSYGIEFRVLDLDLGRAGASEELFSKTLDLDVGLLVTAAGFGTSGDLLESDISIERNLLEVNCGAVLEQCHKYGRRLRERKRGGIVLMSSLLAFQGTPKSANYSASKAYIQNLAEALGRELKPHHVDVIASAPGPIRSGFASRARMKMSFSATPRTVARGTLRWLGRKSTVRPGLLSLVLEYSLRLLPRSGRVAIMGRIMGKMTGSV